MLKLFVSFEDYHLCFLFGVLFNDGDTDEVLTRIETLVTMRKTQKKLLFAPVLVFLSGSLRLGYSQKLQFLEVFLLIFTTFVSETLSFIKNTAQCYLNYIMFNFKQRFTSFFNYH